MPFAEVAWRAGRSAGTARHAPNFGPGGDYPTTGTADRVGIGVVWGRPGTYRLRVRVPGYRTWDTTGVRVAQGTTPSPPYAPAHCATGPEVVVGARLQPDPAAGRAFAAELAATRADTIAASLRPALAVGGMVVRAAARLEPGGDRERFVRLDSLRLPHPDTAGPVLRIAATLANRGARAATVYPFGCGLEVALYPAGAAPPVLAGMATPSLPPPSGPRVPPAWRSVGGGETRAWVGVGRHAVGCNHDPPEPRRLAPGARLTPDAFVARVPATWVLEDVAASLGAPAPAAYVVAVRPRFGLGRGAVRRTATPGEPAGGRPDVDEPLTGWLYAGVVRLAPRR